MKRTFAIILFAACSNAGGGGNHHNPTDAPGGHSPDAAEPDSPTNHAARTIFTIVMENHDYAEIVGSSDAPYINSLIAAGGLATAYKDTGHPSLPNYPNMISGANQYFGVVDWSPTLFPFPANQPNLGTQMTAANVPWRAYGEDMTTACNLSDSGNWATKHEPFLYFVDMQMSGPCAQNNVDFAANFSADLAANTYRYMWITPNLLDDGHDPSTDPVTGLHQSDAWLQMMIPRIQASPGYQNGGVIFLTWDEAEGRNGDDPDKIPMIVLSPKIKQAGMQSATAYTHTSYTATIEDALGLPRLATSMSQTDTLLEFVNW